MENNTNHETPQEERKIMTGCLSGFLYFLCVVGVSLALALFGWNAARDVLGLIKEEKTATVVVPENFTTQEVAGQLKELGLIEQPWLFSLFAKITDAEEKIDPGTYEVRSTLDYRAMVYAMRESATTREEIRLSIPEGYTLKQIIALLAEKGVATEESLWETAQNHDYDYDFLNDVPMTRTRLEGYLFPDTYDFFIKETPASVFNKMLANFDLKLTEEMRERAVELNMPLSEIITMASLVEREAANDDERGLIASVIYNRLKSDRFPYLNIDASIQYILETPKPRLTEADTKIDNPYNTYLYGGLPPGPIANPGLNSIRAALYPDESGYYYYALTPDGHQFSKTLAEHEKVVAANKDFYATLS